MITRHATSWFVPRHLVGDLTFLPPPDTPCQTPGRQPQLRQFNHVTAIPDGISPRSSPFGMRRIRSAITWHLLWTFDAKLAGVLLPLLLSEAHYHGWTGVFDDEHRPNNTLPDSTLRLHATTTTMRANVSAIRRLLPRDGEGVNHAWRADRGGGGGHERQLQAWRQIIRNILLNSLNFA